MKIECVNSTTHITWAIIRIRGIHQHDIINNPLGMGVNYHNHGWSWFTLRLCMALPYNYWNYGWYSPWHYGHHHNHYYPGYYDYYYSGLNNYVIYSGYQNVSYSYRASNSTNVNQNATHNKEVELIYTGAIKAY